MYDVMDQYLSEAKAARDSLMKGAEESSRRFVEALKLLMKEGEDLLAKFNADILEANARVETMERLRMAQWKGENSGAAETKVEATPSTYIPLPKAEDADVKVMAEKLAPNT